MHLPIVLSSPNATTATSPVEQNTALCYPPLLTRNQVQVTDGRDLVNIAKCAAIHASESMDIPVTYMSHGKKNNDVNTLLIEIVRGLCPATEPSLFCIDLNRVATQYFQFRKLLPGIRLHYAIKCFPDLMIGLTLGKLGASFDCASAEEMEVANFILTNSNSTTSNNRMMMENRVILANPIKSQYDLKCALKYGVTRMTVDCMEEMEKIGLTCSANNKIQCLLRISTDDISSTLPLSSKFGIKCDEDVLKLLKKSLQFKYIQVIGVAFHVGSGAQCLQPYRKAFQRARAIFGVALKNFGMKLNVLDIGGGFPGNDNESKITFKEIANCINHNLHHLFNDINDLQVLAEPGRYISCSCAYLTTRIERVIHSNSSVEKRKKYCIGDGIYGYFRDAWMFDYRYIPSVLYTPNGTSSQDEEVCDLLGVTMEVGDVVSKNVWLPKLNKGDWIVFQNMGSYTSCLTTVRTDIPRANVVYVFCEDD